MNNPINIIRLTPNKSITKGNFAKIWDLTHNDSLYQSLLQAEILSKDKFESCFAQLRKALEALAVDLEATKRVEEDHTLSRAEHVRLIQSDPELKNDNTIKAKKMISDAINRVREENGHSFFSTQSTFKGNYLNFLKDQKYVGYQKKYKKYVDADAAFALDHAVDERFRLTSFVYDLYEFLSEPGTHLRIDSNEEIIDVEGEECRELLKLVYELLKILYEGFSGSYKPDKCPVEQFFPVENDIYVLEGYEGPEYYLLKNARPKSRGEKRELDTLRRLWTESAETPANIINRQRKAGQDQYEKVVLAFPGRPVRLDNDLLSRLSARDKERIAIGMINAVRSLHRPEDPMPHRSLSPAVFRVCEQKNNYVPVLISFETVKDLTDKASFTMNDKLEDDYTTEQLKDFIDPHVFEPYADYCASDIYSLGRLLSYIFTGSPVSDGRGVSQARWELISRMTDIAHPEKRPQIEEVYAEFIRTQNVSTAYAVCSAKGDRDENEDAFFCSGLDICWDASSDMSTSGEAKLPVMLGVFDGVGGEEAGEIIARRCAELTRQYSRNLLLQKRRDYRQLLAKLAADLDEDIKNYRKENSLIRSASTMAVCLISGNILSAVNVGDSRIYLIRDGKIRQLSKDHTRPSVGQVKGALYQYIGMPADIEIEPFTVQTDYRKGDAVLLCTDGLNDKFSDEKILDFMLQSRTLEDKALDLAFLSPASGEKDAQDNVTVVLFGEEG